MFEPSLLNYEVEKGKPVTVKLNVLVEARELLLFASSQNLELEFTVKFTKIQLKMWLLKMEKQKRLLPSQRLTLQNKPTLSLTSKPSSLLFLMVPCSVLLPMQPSKWWKLNCWPRIKQVMMTKLVSWITVLAGTMKPIRQINAKEYQKVGVLPFGRLTDEQKKRPLSQPTSTVLDLISRVCWSKSWYLQSLLDGKEIPYQDGMGNASTLRARNTLAVVQPTPRQSNSG